MGGRYLGLGRDTLDYLLPPLGPGQRGRYLGRGVGTLGYPSPPPTSGSGQGIGTLGEGVGTPCRDMARG